MLTCGSPSALQARPNIARVASNSAGSGPITADDTSSGCLHLHTQVGDSCHGILDRLLQRLSWSCFGIEGYSNSCEGRRGEGIGVSEREQRRRYQERPREHHFARYQW